MFRGDFVEAPSQMLQNWVWDKKVLDTFAADYRDPSKKIPAETIRKNEGRANWPRRACYYRRQFAFASLDLALHDVHPEGPTLRLRGRFQIRSWKRCSCRSTPDTTFVSYFGHLNGYDAGYYGYAWADAIAADMATVFEKAKSKYLDREAGLRLRHEIYEPGDARDVSYRSKNFSAANNRSSRS